MLYKPNRLNLFKIAANTSENRIKNEENIRQEYTTCWTKEKVSETLATFAKNYDIHLADCAFTCFELNLPDNQWNRTCEKLVGLDIKNPSYIKEM
ncbi:unnamed protein product [Rotaria sp. Silwood1]|nr:unnamed protein product [Rotaria sp. Silwood1]CAF1574848.1 unnamed protein product [Rotaria sp. Silwood1]CAF3663361.1 unnamed protein product [Rotaria sp. Silwood1]CAF3716762.1 unnamed protein product [Rotaria sp. Silwood1]CAF3729639.1 unnamed protein product [Rotaria sp. Silwood1]